MRSSKGGSRWGLDDLDVAEGWDFFVWHLGDPFVDLFGVNNIGFPVDLHDVNFLPAGGGQGHNMNVSGWWRLVLSLPWFSILGWLNHQQEEFLVHIWMY